VRDVAARLGLSRSRFEHLFRDETGRAFRTALREVRLLLARNLLRDPSLRIKEVACTCGYRSVPSFSREFKRRFGRSPSRWRDDRPG
jgi:AraC-like DNA-binding protein